MRDPLKGHAALRKGRWSVKDAFYFKTVCLSKGQSGLSSKTLFQQSLNILKQLELNSCKAVQGLVHMPDPIHILIELNSETKLQDVMRLYKGRMSPTLRKHQLNWEDGYHDRRLRPNDSVGSVLRYMLLNPYRKGLLDANDLWAFWYCSKETEAWISIAQEKNVPLPEWM